MERLKKVVLSEKFAEYAFYAILFCVYFIWSLMLRYNDAPDENGRYSIAYYIFNHGRLPHGGEPEIIIKEWGFSYGFQPILSYMIGGVFIKITSFFTSNEYFYIIAARFVSVICGVVMAVYIRKASKLLFERRDIQWLFTFLVMLLPQCMFMFVYVNTDSMALMSSAMIVYSWVLGLKSGWNLKSQLTLSFGIIFCALSYYNAYGFILCSIIIFITSFYKITETGSFKEFDYRGMLRKGLLIAAVVLIGCGWWFVRSYILYDGDFLGLSIRDEYGNRYAEVEHLKPSKANTFYKHGYSVFKMFKDTTYIQVLCQSFIGMFGYMDMVLDSVIYTIYAWVIGAGTAGLILGKRIITPISSLLKKDRLVFHLCMPACIIIPIVLCTWSAYAIDYQPQGRYILPMTVPFMYYITLGIDKLLNRIVKSNTIYVCIVGAVCALLIVCVYLFMKNTVFEAYFDVFKNFVLQLINN